MNCLCNPPQLAVLKTCNNERNPGKQYFTCPNPHQNSRCKLFTWVGASMPMSLAFGRNRFPSKSKKSADANKSTSPQKINGKFEAKLLVHEIMEGPPVEIWLSIQCPTTPVVSDLFSRLPPGKSKFNNGLKMWIFNFDQYERIKYEFTTPPFDAIYLPDLVKFLAKGLANFQKKFNKLSAGADPPLNLTPLIRSKILPFQLETVKFVVRRGGRALLGDEMGCGKTLQAISIMMHYRQYWPVLIVVPSSLMKQWPDEILNYAGDMVRPTDIKTIGQSSKMSTGLITIITYKVMDNLVGHKLLSPEQFGVVIADESHNLKNKDSQRSQAIIPFLQKASVAICMTGTPAVNRPVELYSQLNGILPEVFNEYKEFVYRYCDAKSKGNLPGLNVSGSSNEQELNLLLTSLVMVRRTKDQVLKELPEKRREIRNVDPDPEYLPQLRAIQAHSKRLEDQLQSNPQMDPTEFQKLSNEKQQLLTQLYSVTGYAKIKAIKEELVKLIEESRAERGAKRVVTAPLLADTPGNSSDSDLDSFAPHKGPKKLPFDHDSSTLDATQVMTLDSPSQQATQKLDLHAPSSFTHKNDNSLVSTKPTTTTVTTNTVTTKGGTARAPILLELEDDFMNCDEAGTEMAAKREIKPTEVQDLCDSDSSAVESIASDKPSHKRLKKSFSSKVTEGGKAIAPAVAMGTADSSDEDGFLTANEATADEGGGCYWEDSSSDCDFNLSDIKNGKTGKSTRTTSNSSKTVTAITNNSKSANKSMHTDSDEGNGEKGVFSLFDQRVKNQAKRKKSTKSTTVASKKSEVNGTNSHTTGSKGGKKNATKDSDGEQEQENESDEDDEVSDYDPTKRPTSQLERVGQKIIVFFHHKNVLSAIEDSLLKLRVKYVKIDGSTSQKNRGKLVEQFQNDNVTEVALLSITACGVGLNLTRANVALFGELNWSLGAVLQAEDRIHRLGQVAKIVRIIYMIARGTLDENIWDQLQNKHQVVGATVGTSGKPNYGGGMSINSSSNHNNTASSNNNINSNTSNNSNTTATNTVKPAADMRAYLASAAQTHSALPPPPPHLPMSVPAPPIAVPLHTSSNSSYNHTTTVPGYGSYGSNPAGNTNGITVSNCNPYTSNTGSCATANSSSGYHSASNMNHASGYGAPTNTYTSTNINCSASNASNLAQGPPQRSASINNPYNSTSSAYPTSGYHNVNNASSNTAYSNNIAINNTSHATNPISNMSAPMYPPPAHPSQPTISANSYNASTGYTSISTNNAVPSRGYSYPPATTTTINNSSTSYPNTTMHHVSTSLTNDSKPNSYATSNTVYTAPKPAFPAPSVPSLPPTAASFVANINGPQEEFAYSASTQASHSSEATSAESKGSDHYHNQTTGTYSNTNVNYVNNNVSNTGSDTRNTYNTNDTYSAPRESGSNHATMPVPQREAMAVPSGYSTNSGIVSGYTNNSGVCNTNSTGYNIAAHVAVPGQAVYPVPSVQTPAQQITHINRNSVHPNAPSTVPVVPYPPTHINATNARGSNITAVPVALVQTSSVNTHSTVISNVTIPSTNITPVNTSTSSNKAPLPPEMLARIEANRLAAQARLLAARQQKSTSVPAPSSNTNMASTSINSSSISNVPSAVANSAPPAVPATMAMSPAQKSYPPNTSSTAIPTAPFAVGSPVALQAVLQSRQATANVPPGIVNGANSAAARIATNRNNKNSTTYSTTASSGAAAGTSSGTYSGYGTNSSAGLTHHMLPPNTTTLPTPAPAPAAHVFSTGRGTSIPVSDAKMQQAAALLDSAVLPTGVPRVVPGHTAPAPYPSNGGAYSGYSSNNPAGQVIAPVSAPPGVFPPSAAPVVSVNASSSSMSSAAPLGPLTVPTTTATTSTSNPTSTTAYTAGTLYFDGTAQSSLHRGGAGYQLFASNGRTLRENGVRLSGTCSSNQAEYVGLIQGLTAALHSGVQDLQVYGDSEVVIKQMLGIYPVRNPALQGMFTRAKALLGRFRRIQLQWIPKEKNAGASALSQRALHQPETVTENCDWFVSSVVS